MGLQNIYKPPWGIPGVRRENVARSLAQHLDDVDDLKGALNAIVATTACFIEPQPAEVKYWLQKTPTDYYYMPTLERMYRKRARSIYFCPRSPRCFAFTNEAATPEHAGSFRAPGQTLLCAD